MTYLLYLKRSFFRNPRRHLTLAIILICSFLLPLLISIYRNSNAYGTRQYLLSRSQGETWHIQNATEADLPHFDGIIGVSSPVLRDGTIFLHILSDEDWKNPEGVQGYESELKKRIEQAGNSNLHVTAYDYEYAHGISSDSAYLLQQRVLFFVNVLVILLATGVIRSSYKSHLRHFSEDVGTLFSCGANRQQIARLFAVEFLILFVLASAISTILSVITLRALFTAFLEIRHDALSWLIFHVEPINILIHFIIYLAVLGTVLWFTLRKFNRESTWALLNDSENTVAAKRDKKKLKLSGTQTTSLCSLWQRRTGEGLRDCLKVSISMMILFLLLFNILKLALNVAGADEKWGLRLSNDRYTNELTAEDMAYISSLEGVKEILPVYEFIDTETGRNEFLTAIEISLTSPSLNGAVESSLKAHFNSGEFSVLNRQSGADYFKEMTTGVYLLLGYIFVALFLFVVIIICVKLYEYIGNSRNTIRSLHVLGASQKVLRMSYIRQTAISAGMAVLVPFLICLPITVLICVSQGVRFSFDGVMFAVYAVVAAVMFIVYLLPIHLSLNRVMRQF